MVVGSAGRVVNHENGVVAIPLFQVVGIVRTKINVTFGRCNNGAIVGINVRAHVEARPKLRAHHLGSPQNHQIRIL